VDRIFGSHGITQHIVVLLLWAAGGVIVTLAAPALMHRSKPPA
jgi:hypothetical protein